LADGILNLKFRLSRIVEWGSIWAYSISEHMYVLSTGNKLQKLV